jgi:membrane protease YdiL (CAAX protease family)
MPQVIIFLGVVFAVPWVLLVPLRSAPPSLSVLLAWLFPTVWTPTIAALVLTFVGEGLIGVKQELRARFRYRSGAGRWLALAVVLPVVTTLMAVFMARHTGAEDIFIAPSGIPMMVALQIATGALAEELGWRGFLVPRLRARFGRGGIWVMAALWSAWHIAAFFFPLTAHAQLIPAAPNLLLTVFFGVFLGFLFDRGGDSILPTIAAHLSLNIMSGVGGIRLSSPVFWWTMVGIHGAVALLVTRMDRRQPAPAVQMV